jgi:GAF domain-containing protein
MSVGLVESELDVLRRELTQARAEQSATADVLAAIGNPTVSLEDTLVLLIRSAIALCGGERGVIWIRQGETLVLGAHFGYPRDWVEHALATAILPAADSPTVTGRVAFTAEVSNVADLPNDPRFKSYDAHRLGDYRGSLAAPLKHGGSVIGVIGLTRPTPGLFTERQVDLIRRFADQAVIAVSNAKLVSDTREALDRQTATAGILRVISESPTDAKPVFDRIVETARSVLHCETAVMILCEGDSFYSAAVMTSKGLVTTLSGNRLPIDVEANFPSRAIVHKEVLHIPDWSLIPLPEHERKVRNEFKVNSSLYLPLVRSGECIGLLALVGTRPNNFGPKDIAQAEAFRDQALIAIENARLFNETQDALERQTATSEILRVISQSPTDAQPVFGAIVSTAVRALRCDVAFVLMRDEDVYIHSAGASPEGLMTDLAPDRVPIDPSANFPSRAFLAGEMLYLADWSRIELPEHERNIREAFGVNSALYLPMMRDGQCIALLALVGKRPNSFGPGEIAQAESFRDQALIAIENARLFNETREALEQLQASASILSVISNSVADAKPVFEAILESCRHLFGGDELDVLLVDENGQLTIAAYLGKFYDIVAPTFPAPVERTPAGRAIRERRAVHWPDLAHGEDVPGILRKMAKLTGYRSMTFAPMLLGDRGIGAIGVARSTGPFQPKELAMLQTFADQAVIAIENARLFNETREALDQQTATADVLQVIGRSVSDAAPVFETIMEACQRLFGLEAVAVYLVDGDLVRGVAHRGWSYGDWGKDVTPLASSSTGVAIAERRTVHFPDLADKPDLPDHFRAPIRESGGLTILYAPMLWEDRGVGSLVLSRRPAKPFSEKEMKLVQSFADQATIAIQNARLFEDVRNKTRDLEESLAQQTATADVLKVISRSGADLDVMLQRLADTAAMFCGNSAVHLEDEGLMKVRVVSGGSSDWVDYLRKRPFPADPSTQIGRAWVTGEIVHIPDILGQTDLPWGRAAEISGYRSTVSVPIVSRSHGVVGVFSYGSGEAHAFPPRRQELLKSFADQAAIAIDNARLLDEVRGRTRDLEESLAQQTATADVLKVISRSAFDFDRAASTILEAAARLCRATMATLHLRDGDVCRLATQIGMPEAFERLAREVPIPVKYPLHSKRPARAGEVAHFADAWSDPDYLYTDTAKLAGYRAVVIVPLMREGELLGIFSLARPGAGPFTESQIKLTQTFADQAAIAIENARLFKETQDSLEQQTATADVLKVISRSAFDLQPVFDMVAESAVRLCEAERAVIFRFDGEVLRAVAAHNVGPELWQFVVDHPVAPGMNSISARAALFRRTVQVNDIQSDPDYAYAPRDVDLIRTMASVPLIKGDNIVGTITIYKLEVKPFTDRQLALVETFAEQAVIAIENVRLFDEVQARTEQLAASLEELRAAQDRLVQTEKLASLGQLTAGIAHEIKNPLNFVNNFSALSVELVDELRDVLAPVPLEDAVRAEVEEISGMLKGNLEKVASHGKRADSIVRNMLLHSRSGSGERRRVDVNGLVEESLNLAYHGARAETAGFNVTLDRDYDGSAGEAELFPQEVTRVLLNLIGNGFYAVRKKAEDALSGYEPRLLVATRNLGPTIEIRVRDNGTGIPEHVKQKMFDPFYTTKPAGEGTGLGLSLSHDIVVKQHGGRIDVQTEPGSFTEFTMILPRSAAAPMSGGEA